MPRASTKVFKKRRGVFNKGRCKSNDGCGESNSTVPKNSADEKKIVLMVQSFVLMKLNHLPIRCKFKKAELLGETYHHKNSLPVDVVEAMDLFLGNQNC
ncbi:hypothetical protein TNCV_3104021 [Trichonephila clavipes]|nr:hypothetical protein TNCV_3104021 [Trichonephila clavipes]